MESLTLPRWAHDGPIRARLAQNRSWPLSETNLPCPLCHEAEKPDHAAKLFSVTVAVVALPLSLAIAIASGADPGKGLVPAAFFEILAALWESRDTYSAQAMAIVLASMALIVVLRRAAPKLPGRILAVGATSAIVAMAALPVDTIYSRFGDLPRGLPLPAFPAFTLTRVTELLPSAFVIAFLAGVESLLSAIVADRMMDGRHRPNAEVLAQGIANIGSALFGGRPATGAIARTATNIRAGGKTPVVGIVHAVTIFLVMWIAAPLAGYLAMPALAALLILTAWNMREPHKWRSYLAARRSDQFLLLMTMTLPVVVDLTVAIGVGVAVGLALRLRRRGDAKTNWTNPDR